MFKVKITADALRNASVQISGGLPSQEEGKFKLVKFEHLGLKLTSVLFLIQEKAGLYLWWDEDNLILPVESRGAFKFDIGLKAPEDWDGQIWGQAFKTEEFDKAFLLIMDFDK